MPTLISVRRALVGVLALALLPSMGWARTADAAPTNLVTNGDFSAVDASGLPTTWRLWRPAGDAIVTVEPAGGPKGEAALRIAANGPDDTTDRTALVHTVNVSDATPRSLTLTGWMKAEGLSGGWTSLRVQARDAENATTVPVAYVGRDTGSFGWREVSHTFDLPAGTNRVMIEPMLDRSGGSVWFANISLHQTPAEGALSATARPDGVVELGWRFDSISPARYVVHRAEDTQPAEWGATHVVGQSPATAWADTRTEAGRTYVYMVSAVNAQGQTLASTAPVSVTTPSDFVSAARNTVATAIQTDAGAKLSWTPAADLTADTVQVYRSSAPLATPTGSPAASVPLNQRELSIAAVPGDHLTLVANGAVIASTRVGALSHPRTGPTAERLPQIKARIASDATVRGAWQDSLRRLADNNYPATTSGALYKAREAALAYAVTNEQAYADEAFAAVQAAESHVKVWETNMGLELGRALLLLPTAYDWAYNGWTDDQRAYTRDLIVKASDLLSTYHHDALDNEQKTSNWVAVARTTELMGLLTVRGDGEVGARGERITFLTDQVMQHLDQGYTDKGYSQEGWDYFMYGGLYMLPSAYAAHDAGQIDLMSHLERPAWWNVTLHTISARTTLDAAQWGVGTPKNQTHGILPLLMPLTPDDALPGLRWLYNVTRGVDAPTPLWDGTANPMTVLYWSPGTSQKADLTAPAAHSALLDTEPGSFFFRSGYTGPDDVLATINNRGTHHKGWSGSETFGLSLMSDDTTWALAAGKSLNPLHASKPLVDGKIEPRLNQYETIRGEGLTLDTRAFTDQGGGYVHLDGHRNFEIDQATRKAVVDLQTCPTTQALLAFDDQFSDASTHTWQWQLRPEAGVTITIDESPTAGAPNFTFSRAGKTLSGWVLADDLTIDNLDGTLRISQQGASARFKVVLTTSRATAPRAQIDGQRFVVDGRTLDFSALEEYAPGACQPQPSVTPEPTDTPTPQPSDAPTPQPSATTTPGVVVIRPGLPKTGC